RTPPAPSGNECRCPLPCWRSAGGRSPANRVSFPPAGWPVRKNVCVSGKNVASASLSRYRESRSRCAAGGRVAAMQGRSVTELMHDYLDVLERTRDLPPEVREQVEAHFQFIQRNKHLLDRHPSALLSLAHAQAEDSRVLQAARDRNAGAELE